MLSVSLERTDPMRVYTFFGRDNADIAVDEGNTHIYFTDYLANVYIYALEYTSRSIVSTVCRLFIVRCMCMCACAVVLLSVHLGAVKFTGNFLQQDTNLSMSLLSYV